MSGRFPFADATAFLALHEDEVPALEAPVAPQPIEVGGSLRASLETPQEAVYHMAMGQNPNRTSSEHPNLHYRLKRVVHLPTKMVPLVLTHGHITRFEGA